MIATRLLIMVFLFTIIFPISPAAATQPEGTKNSKTVSSAIKNNSGDIIIEYGGTPITVGLSSFATHEPDSDPVEFGEPLVAKNKKAVGWTLLYKNCCTSYPIPGGLIIYQDGKVLQEFNDGQMIWNWSFWHDGEEVAIQSGPTHGDQCTYSLYKTRTKTLLSESECGLQNLPDWAVELNERHKIQSP